MSDVTKTLKEWEMAKAESKAITRDIVLTEQAIQEKERPFYEHISKLNEEMKKATEELYKKLNDLRTVDREIDKKVEEADKAYKLSKWENVVPENKERFVEWWNDVARYVVHANPYSDYEIIKRTPRVDGATVYGMSDGDTDRYYVAYMPGKGVIGWLHVEPSQHAGDYTSATAVVEGEKLDGYGRICNAPLKRWCEEVGYVACPDIAPAWERVKKAKDAPSGSIVRMWVGRGWSRQYEYGVVLGYEGDGRLRVLSLWVDTYSSARKKWDDMDDEDKNGYTLWVPKEQLIEVDRTPPKGVE